MSKWSKIFSGGAALVVFALISKIIGVFYRLPLTNIIGAEGMGLYQLIYPLYALILTVTGGGLPAAVSKVTSEFFVGGNEEGARRILRTGLLSVTGIAVVFAAILCVFSRNISLVQGNENGGIAYIGIAPAIVFSGMLACFRGYYQGKRNLFPSGMTQIIEQLIKLVVGLALASFFLPYGVGMAVFGAMLGVSVSELVALVFIVLEYFFDKSKTVRKISLTEAAADVSMRIPYLPGRKEALRKIYAVALPITIGSLVLPLTQAIDSLLVINVLVYSGAEKNAATVDFGLFSGCVNSLINMPTVISSSLAAAMLPRIATGKDEKPDIYLKYTLALTIPAAIIFALFAQPLLSAFYARGLSIDQIRRASVLLAAASINPVLIGIIQISSAAAQAKDKAAAITRNLFVGAIIKVLFTLLLLPILGIVGGVVGSVIGYSVTMVCDLITVKRAGLRFSLRQPLVIVGASLVFAAASYACSEILPITGIIKTVVAIGIGAVVYLIILVKVGTVSLSEIAGKLSKQKNSNKKSV